LKHLKSLHTFTDKPGQEMLADFEQQLNPALALSSAAGNFKVTIIMTGIKKLYNFKQTDK